MSCVLELAMQTRSLHTLDFSYNIINRDVSVTFLNLLTNLSSLTTLNLSNTEILNIGVSFFCFFRFLFLEFFFLFSIFLLEEKEGCVCVEDGTSLRLDMHNDFVPGIRGGYENEWGERKVFFY